MHLLNVSNYLLNSDVAHSICIRKNVSACAALSLMRITFTKSKAKKTKNKMALFFSLESAQKKKKEVKS